MLHDSKFVWRYSTSSLRNFLASMGNLSIDLSMAASCLQSFTISSSNQLAMNSRRRRSVSIVFISFTANFENILDDHSPYVSRTFRSVGTN